MEKLTLKEAIEHGYTFAGEEGGEHIIKLSEIDKCEEHYNHYDLWLCELEPRYMQLSEDEISDNIAEIIDCNEEFYSDEDLSSEAFEGTDELFKALTDKINENLKKHKFWFLTETKLELTPQERKEKTI